MGRRLPVYDPQVDGPWELSKRRLQIFKRVYQNYWQWQALREAGEVDDVITIEGEDIYLGDLMVGLDTLPRQQRRAFELICRMGYTESAATKKILPKSNWSTPVQQYSDDGLRKMVAAYDAKQAGTWDPEAVKRKRRIPRKKDEEVTTSTADSASAESTKGRRWDFTQWSEDHAALAEYINKEAGVGITPAQVKAVAFLRKPWWHSDAQVAERERRETERKALKDKYAYETKEQREARHAANRALKSHENALARAQAELDRVKDLRRQAGLDPETGEPVAS